MSPEAVNYIGIAEAMLARAHRSFLAEIYEDAARSAYLAMLNAARAIIFDKEGLATKTHSGVRTKMYDMLRGGLVFDKQLVDFLATAFETKQSVDYGPEIVLVDRTQAEDYLNRAAAFLAAAKAVCG
ncbi:MAG: HEPN domain-containing protein [Rhizomicrobium sp.]|jgi:uncharacterized protein (UPF0332 family)